MYKLFVQCSICLLGYLLLAQTLEPQAARQLVANEHAQMLRRQLHKKVLQRVKN